MQVLPFSSRPKERHCLFQLEPSPADIPQGIAPDLNPVVLLDHDSGFIRLLVVDIDDACHNHGFGPFTALCLLLFHKHYIQSFFQCKLSPNTVLMIESWSAWNS